jgi:hypothetical protein
MKGIIWWVQLEKSKHFGRCNLMKEHGITAKMYGRC